LLGDLDTSGYLKRNPDSNRKRRKFEKNFHWDSNLGYKTSPSSLSTVLYIKMIN